MALTIPHRLQDTFVRLFELGDSGRDDVLKAIQQTAPGASTAEYRRNLEEQLPDLSAEWSQKFVQCFFSLYNLGEVLSDPDNTSKELITALQKLNSEITDKASDEQFESFQTFLTDVLTSHDSLGIGAKATKLMLEHERVFVFPEIFSDIRTIFKQDAPEEQPVTAVITHSLKIHTHVNGRSEDIFFAMDYNDLSQLKETVERALTKHKTLAGMIEQLGIKHFELEEDFL